MPAPILIEFDAKVEGADELFTKLAARAAALPRPVLQATWPSGLVEDVVLRGLTEDGVLQVQAVASIEAWQRHLRFRRRLARAIWREMEMR